MAIGLCSLLVIEGGATAVERAAGRPANEFFYTPVFERRGGGFVTRPERRGYFVTQEFSALKLPGTVRIFILGGSTALGFPFQGEYGLAELLHSALPLCRGGRSYEVINAAGFGNNSARMAAVAEEALGYSPDALVILTGHNEFLERRAGGAWDFAAGRLFIGLERRLLGRQDTVRWEAHDVTAAERRRVEAGMEAALRRVADEARRRGVKLVLVTCPSNRSDFRPNGPGAVEPAEQKRIDGLVRSEKTDAATAALDQQDSRHPDDAWISFMRGRLRERVLFLGDENPGEGADPWFVRARDLDPRPVRATTAINDLIRRVARESGAVLLDLEPAFAALSRSAAEPVFLDHCHPSYRGQQALARSVLDGLAAAGLIDAPGAAVLAAVTRQWNQAYAVLPGATRAEFYYRAAFEAGVNLRRPCRGFTLAERALAEDPTHTKAVQLRERLRPAQETGCLTGD